MAVPDHQASRVLGRSRATQREVPLTVGGAVPSSAQKTGCSELGEAPGVRLGAGSGEGEGGMRRGEIVGLPPVKLPG